MLVADSIAGRSMVRHPERVELKVSYRQWELGLTGFRSAR
jgi:hypothetical protein